MKFPMHLNGNGYQACVETFSKRQITGWISLLTHYSTKATIQVLVNMVLRGEHTADNFRSDLKEVGIGQGDGCYGFHIDLSQYSQYFSNSVNSVEFRIAQTDTSLMNGSIWFPFEPREYETQVGESASRVLNIYTITFFDLEGNTYYSGGAERYLTDLVELCRGMGFDCKIVQASSTGPWRRHYRDIEVIGVPWNRTSVLELSKAFSATAEPGSRAIFSPFILAAAFCPKESIGISHGIFWDLEGNSYSQGENHVLLNSSLKHLDNLLSVDAATLNFLRGAAPAELNQTNAKVIINYVDNNTFDNALANSTLKPDETIRSVRKLRNEGKTIFVYPRRLYAARGLDILIQTARYLLPAHKDMVILFVGRGDPADTQKVAKLKEEFGSQVFHTWLEADDMPQAYDVADIVLVPTLHSEGTSLSCIEAMQCGKCVVVTHVGGLPELVIHRYNGLVIEPNTKSLLNAMKLLLEDVELRTSLGENARRVAKALSKDIWQAGWKGFLQECYPEVQLPRYPAPAANKVLFYHPPVPGIELDVMNQRPQALMRDLAIMGGNTCFAQYGGTKQPASGLPRGMELISEKAEIFSDHTVILCYYPYSLIAYADEFEKRLTADDLIVFRALKVKYAHHLGKQPKLYSKNTFFWFDYLDHKDIHPDEDARTLIEFGVKYADIVTTSSLLLAESIRSDRTDIVYLGNAVSMDWVSAVGANLAKTTGKVPILNVDVMQDIVAWRRDGFAIGIYWGALADWNDISLLADRDQQVRYIFVGPISSNKIRTEIGLSNVCTHIDYLAPAGLAQLSQLADFALIPFKQNSVTQHVNPLKLWEYLALGLPVVARSTGELEAQQARLSGTARSQVKLVDGDTPLSDAIRQLLSTNELKRAHLPAHTFAAEIGPFLKRVQEVTLCEQELVVTEQDLPVWFVAASINSPQVHVTNKTKQGRGSLLLELPANFDVHLVPRWDLTPPADSSLSKATLQLRINKDVAISKNVRLEIFGRIGNQYQLLGNARPSTNGVCSIELDDLSRSFEQISVQLQLPVGSSNVHGKRCIFLDWEHFELRFSIQA